MNSRNHSKPQHRAGLVLPALALGLTLGLAGAAGAQTLNSITVKPPAPPSQDAATADASDRPVSFTAAQADEGKGLYERYCTICHGADLNDGEFGGAPLNGSHFQEVYVGGPVSSLYYFIEGQMPPDRPGQLTVKERTEVIAYILSRNGFLPGTTPLPESSDAMDHLIVEN